MGTTGPHAPIPPHAFMYLRLGIDGWHGRGGDFYGQTPRCHIPSPRAQRKGTRERPQSPRRTSRQTPNRRDRRLYRRHRCVLTRQHERDGGRLTKAPRARCPRCPGQGRQGAWVRQRRDYVPVRRQGGLQERAGRDEGAAGHGVL